MRGQSQRNHQQKLLRFLGLSYQRVPSIMVKSDQPKSSASSLSLPTLENHFPDSAQLEQEIRTVEEITRALHVQSGFHIFWTCGLCLWHTWLPVTAQNRVRRLHATNWPPASSGMPGIS